MTKLILIGVMAVAAMAQTKSAKPAAARPAAVKPPAGNQLPAGAEKVSEGVWRAKDASGKTWIYTKTPFGFMRAPEGSPDVPPAPVVPEVRVTSIQGDTVKFERETPFGKTVWTRPVSDLNEREKAAYEARQRESLEPQKSRQ